MTPTAVRILPMSSQQEGFRGRSVEQVQRSFFLDQLPNRYAGHYRYNRSGLCAEPGAVVLFQFTRRIIASAVLLQAERWKTAAPDGCTGLLVFEVDSIQVFDPVDVADLRKFWPRVTCLGQAKWNLDPSPYSAFVQSLRNASGTARRA